MGCASPHACQNADQRAYYETTTDCTSCGVPETVMFCPICIVSLRKLLARPTHICELCLSTGTVVMVRIALAREKVPC